MTKEIFPQRRECEREFLVFPHLYLISRENDYVSNFKMKFLESSLDLIFWFHGIIRKVEKLVCHLFRFHGKMKNESDEIWVFLWSSYLISQNNSSNLKKGKSFCGWIWFQRMYYCNSRCCESLIMNSIMKYSNYLTIFALYDMYSDRNTRINLVWSFSTPFAEFYDIIFFFRWELRICVTQVSVTGKLFVKNSIVW